MIHNLILLLSLFYAKPLAHPYHVTITEIVQGQSRTLQLTHKIFYDDLEKAIETKYGVKLHIGSPKQHPKTRDYIFRYLNENFSISLNSKAVQLTPVGFETERDYIFAYMESAKSGNIGKVTVTSKILTETFSDQANIIHMSISGQKKSLFLNATSVQGSETFE